MERAIAEVKEKNDGRFEVLGWGLAALVGLITIMLGVSYINSNNKAEQIAREEIDKMKVHFDEEVKKLKQKLQEELEEVKKIRKSVEDLKLQTETDIQSLTSIPKN